MKGWILILLGIWPTVVLGVTGRSVYPNSGPTNARRFEHTGISPSIAPIEPKRAQREEETETLNRPETEDEFIKGPYDQDGNYRYIPEVRE
jgi:hypothetical protein